LSTRISNHLIPEDTGRVDLGDFAHYFRRIYVDALLSKSGLTITGSLLAPDGTAAAPSVSFKDDTTMGFYRRAATTLSVVFGSSTPSIEFDPGSVTMQANGRFSWSGTAGDASAAEDTFLSRTAAGAVKITTDGTVLGTFNVGTIGTAALPLAKLYADYTNSATIGAVTISKMSGRANIAAAASSVVVTNTLVTAASKVFAVLAAVDATATGIASVVPTAGSFTITANAVATGNTAVDFLVINAD